jgi:molybdenum cofactor biosynthesis enzyme MoaA
MKLTKNCLLPWQFLQVHAGGMMQCCAVGNDTDLGDFIIDHCQKVERGEPSDVLNTPGLRRVREGLLTGNLRPMCRKCFFADSQQVTTNFLRQKLLRILADRLPAGTDLDLLDLTRTHAYAEMAISFTNRCNLSCVYCVQSTQKKVNPYFQMDFPSQYCKETLEFFASQKINLLRSCVEGEATIHNGWYEFFSEFHCKYPHIKLRITTNLSRRYTEREIDLLARYSEIDVSCDSLDPKLYAKLRRGGNLELVLDNLRRICAQADLLGKKRPLITLHVVVSDVTWPGLEDLADYALSHGYLLFLGNYEERANAVAFQKGLCRPLSSMPQDEQVKAHEVLQRIKNRFGVLSDEQRDGHKSEHFFQGGLLHDLQLRAAKEHNRFKPYDDNPLTNAFYALYPLGEEHMHLAIVYDYDNNAYGGVLFLRQMGLRLNNFKAQYVVLREVALFKQGKCSSKYMQTVLPGYRKTVKIENDIFEYLPHFTDDMEGILLEVSEHW